MTAMCQYLRGVVDRSWVTRTLSVHRQVDRLHWSVDTKYLTQMSIVYILRKLLDNNLSARRR